jgi:uncharacterized protein YjbI with pentapeptide repeats
LSGGVFDEGNFSRARVKASFDGASLQQARFDAADLHASFDSCNLRGSSFRGCDLSRCSFKGADLTMCDFTGATLPGTEQMSGAIMRNVRMGNETEVEESYR